ncbi:hypothetical protein YC2023_074874 [Brassica napus]
MFVRIDLKMKLVNLQKETRKLKKHIPMPFVERVKEDFHGMVERLPMYTQQHEQRVWILLALYHQIQKVGEERPGGSCSWILVTLNAEKHNLFDDTLHNWNHSSTNSHIKKQMMEWCGGDHTTCHDYEGGQMRQREYICGGVFYLNWDVLLGEARRRCGGVR